MLAVATALVMLAVPASRITRTVAQPDGGSVTLRLVGDEYYHFSTTLDGYTVECDDAGAVYYVERAGDRLHRTSILAHDVAQRGAAERNFLATIKPRLTDRTVVAQSKALRRQVQAQASRIQRFDYSKFQGLVILVELSDVSFTRSDAQSYYEHMTNERNLKSLPNADNIPDLLGDNTGSVRDYYYDNSMGLFDAKFDVVGPVKVSSYKSTQANANSVAIFRRALNLANSEVDYSKYDTDNNGVVDMVFFIVAGMGSHVYGHDSRLLWPYMSRYLMTGSRLDGKTFDLYACATELLDYYEDTPLFEGIGTMCHEFSHVLGLPDMYDTDYEDQGQSHDPGEWDVMASGCDLNSGRTPCGYTIFERYALGFANPPLITSPGDYTLGALGTTNEGYRLATPVKGEQFMLENRQPTKWDKYLPGHGLIIARVDSTNVSAWDGNNVNDDPAHNYYELLRAGGTTQGDLDSDPFPGTAGVTMVSNNTTANLKTWNGTDNPFALTAIAEDGTDISFKVLNVSDIQSDIEDFETMPVSTGASVTGVEGRFANWSFNKCNVQAPGEGKCDGEHAVGMYSPSAISMDTEISRKIYMVTASVFNPTAYEATFKLYQYDASKSKWVEVDDAARDVAARASVVISWNVDVDKPTRFRLGMTAGTKSTSNRTYVDNITFYHNGSLSPVFVKGDVNGDGEVTSTDISIVVNIIAGLDSNDNYGGRADVNGDGEVTSLDIAEIVNILAGL